MKHQTFTQPVLKTTSHLIQCEETGAMAIVDPDRDVVPYLSTPGTITDVILTRISGDVVTGHADLPDATLHTPDDIADTVEVGTLTIDVTRGEAGLTLEVGDMTITPTESTYPHGFPDDIRAINAEGPLPVDELVTEELPLNGAIHHLQHGSVLIDARSRAAYVARHIPGALHMPPTDIMTRLPMALTPEAPIVVIGATTETVLALARMGYQKIVGSLPDLEAWAERGLMTASDNVRDMFTPELAARLGEDLVLIDVREPFEYRQAHIAEAELIPLGQFAAHIDKLDPETPVALICKSGQRSLSAGRMLDERGFDEVYNVIGGMLSWQNAGYDVE